MKLRGNSIYLHGGVIKLLNGYIWFSQSYFRSQEYIVQWCPWAFNLIGNIRQTNKIQVNEGKNKGFLPFPFIKIPLP